MMDARVDGSSQGGWREEIRRLPGVAEVELIDATDQSALYRVVYRGDPFVPLLRRLRLLRHLPIPIRQGVATWRIVGPETRVRALLRALESSGVVFAVEALRHGAVDVVPASLTPRQREVLRQALSEGYFDVPRRISLTKLAAKVGVAISTLSVTLAVIERKILEPIR